MFILLLRDFFFKKKVLSTNVLLLAYAILLKKTTNCSFTYNKQRIWQQWETLRSNLMISSVKNVKRTLEKFELDVAPHKILNFLDIVSDEFNKNLTTEEKNLIARIIGRIVTGAFNCIKTTEEDTDESNF